MGSSIFIVIRTLLQVLSLLVIVDSVLSFVIPPVHPIRVALGTILNPLYAPIRRFLPSTGGFDLSPLILFVLIQVISNFISNLAV